MKTFCVYINLCSAYACMMLENLSNDFPCFIETGNPDSMGIAELTIQCREEDAASIENMIADLV